MNATVASTQFCIVLADSAHNRRIDDESERQPRRAYATSPRSILRS